ncbi:hypothetical protein IHE45_20G002700 [Dioscorea alata]|uniref:Uncharacterized protein n=1 Tax=Dioscorea alata TaxID=55571 RepID=A0ACB7TPE4_DIOAL|nr:hypothetical protein IHE45_20G002700 [Dioscorea alata]
MWVVDMMSGVVLSVVLWVVLSVVIPIFGFVVMMLVVMFWVVVIMLRVGLMMLRVVRMINRDKYSQLEENLPYPQFLDIILPPLKKTLHIVLMMLRIMLRMLRDHMMKKMARVRDDLTKLQEKLEMAYRKLEYADEERMIVPYGTTHTLFHNLIGVSNDLQDISDELFKHEDTLRTMATIETMKTMVYQVLWKSSIPPSKYHKITQAQEH